MKTAFSIILLILVSCFGLNAHAQIGIDPIPNYVRQLNGETLIIPLDDFFEDEEGATLTYSTSTSNADLAVITVSTFDVLTVEPSGLEGVTTITVTADNGQESVSDSFMVTFFQASPPNPSYSYLIYNVSNNSVVTPFPEIGSLSLNELQTLTGPSDDSVNVFVELSRPLLANESLSVDDGLESSARTYASGEYLIPLLSESLYPGTFNVVIEFTEAGGVSSVETLNFETTFSAELVGYTLSDGFNDKDIFALRSGDIIDLVALSDSLDTQTQAVTDSLNIEVNTDPEKIEGQVFLSLFALLPAGTDTLIAERSEQNAPYFVFGDDNMGDVAGFKFEAGSYRLNTSGFFSREGVPGQGYFDDTIFFEISQSNVSQITLIDADKDQPISEITNNGSIDRRQLLQLEPIPDLAMLNIEAEVEDPFDLIDRVEFAIRIVSPAGAVIREETITDDDAPYTLFGESNVSDYNGEDLPLGNYNIVATPIIENSLGSYRDQAQTVAFSVIDGVQFFQYELLNKGEFFETLTSKAPPINLNNLDSIDSLSIEVTVRDPLAQLNQLDFTLTHLGTGKVTHHNSPNPYRFVLGPSPLLGTYELITTGVYKEDINTSDLSPIADTTLFTLTGTIQIDGFSLVGSTGTTLIPDYDPLQEGQTVIGSYIREMGFIRDSVDVLANVNQFSSSIASITFQSTIVPLSGPPQQSEYNDEFPPYLVYNQAEQPLDSLSEGTYSIKATINLQPGTEPAEIQTDSITFSIIERVQLTGFSLYHGTNLLRQITEGDTIDLVDEIANAEAIDSLYIMADLNIPDPSEYIEAMSFEGEFTRTNSSTPVSISGDSTPGSPYRFYFTREPDFNRLVEITGSYSLRAIPVSVDSLRIPPLSINLDVKGPRIETFSFINADDGQSFPGLSQIQDTISLDITRLPEKLNILANTRDFPSPAIGDVIFNLSRDGRVIGLPDGGIDSFRPYTVFNNCTDFPNAPGCSQDEDSLNSYFAWENPTNGFHVLSANYEVDGVFIGPAELFFEIDNALPLPASISRIDLLDANENQIADFSDIAPASIIDILAPRILPRFIRFQLESNEAISDIEPKIGLIFESGATLQTIELDTQVETVNPNLTRILVPLDSLQGAGRAYTKARLFLGGTIDHTGNRIGSIAADTLTILGPRVVQYVLINAETDEVIQSLGESESAERAELGAIDSFLNLDKLPDSLNIRAEVQDFTPFETQATIQSVSFRILKDGQEYATYNDLGFPYSVFGDESPNFTETQDNFSEAGINYLAGHLEAGRYTIETKWGNEDEISDTFGQKTIVFVLEESPSIEIDDISNTSDSIEVRVRITDNGDVIENPQIHFRTAGATSFITTNLEQIDQDLYGFNISSIFPSMSNTVEYAISAQDSMGLTANFPLSGIRSIPVQIDGNGIINSNPSRYGESAYAYQLISIPLDLDSKHPEDVLYDDLGEHDELQWRLFEANSRTEYFDGVELTADRAEFSMTPGRPYWLIARNEYGVINSGAGQTIPTDVHYAHKAPRSEWSYFGTPFNYPIPISNLYITHRDSSCARESEITRPIVWTYEEGWFPLEEISNTIEPFKGYGLEKEAEAVNLCIDPIVTTPPDLFKHEPQPTISEPTADQWNIRIKAFAAQSKDTYNVLGIHSDASEARDAFDRREPPGVGEYVSLYFAHPEWELSTNKYSRDIRPPSDLGGHIWPIEIETNVEEKVTLLFDQLQDLPEHYQIWLVDSLAQASHDLKLETSYSFMSSTNTRRFDLYIGTEAFIEQQQRERGLIPREPELSQNFPNPFISSTTIRYGLVEADQVTLEIYNILGQRVALLEENREREAGFHAIVWNGKTSNGESLASGVYFAQVRTKSFTKTITLTKVR